jgi:hypothetical protein
MILNLEIKIKSVSIIIGAVGLINTLYPSGILRAEKIRNKGNSQQDRQIKKFRAMSSTDNSVLSLSKRKRRRKNFPNMIVFNPALNHTF